MTYLKILYFILFGILITIGTISGIPYAVTLPTITLDGDVIATDNFEVNGTISSQTITDLDLRISILEGGS